MARNWNILNDRTQLAAFCDQAIAACSKEVAEAVACLPAASTSPNATPQEAEASRKSAAQYKRVSMFIVGEAIKASQGRANPAIIAEIMHAKLREFKK